jgi:hypothetical protein
VPRRRPQGGISKVSCFAATLGAQTCHITGPSGHPADWATAGQHGKFAKGSPLVAGNGFNFCQTCHGTQGTADFTGGSSKISCQNSSCHGTPNGTVDPPHPVTPWHGTTASGTTHVTTDQGNATVCGQCHRNGAFLTSISPPPVQPASTPTGCFNNTMCHGGSVGHPAGWADPASANFHGPVAKAVPGPASGFSYCQTCHGTDFTGGTAGVSCFSNSVSGFNCHDVNGVSVGAPHPPKPWFPPTIPFNHTTTDHNNAPVCAACHLGGQNLTDLTAPPAQPAGTPVDCFNNTLCHATFGAAGAPHPLDGTYLPYTAHGVDARKDLTACQVCHTTPNTGGPGSNPRFNVVQGTRLPAGCETSGCHAPQTAHPIPWLPGSPVDSRSITSHQNAGNLSVACALCHGATLAGGAGPSCMGGKDIFGTGCHVSSPAVNPTGCVSCHGNPPNGTAFPNLEGLPGNHTEHNFPNVTGLCNTCHNGGGTGTAFHGSGTVTVSVLSVYNAKTGATSYTADASAPISSSTNNGGPCDQSHVRQSLQSVPAGKSDFVHVREKKSRQMSETAGESELDREIRRVMEKGRSIDERKRQVPAIYAAFARRTAPQRARRLAALCYTKTLGTPFMPVDLAEIALCETGDFQLSGTAVSSEGARGVWQLMPYRAKSHGYSPEDMKNDEKCAAAAVRELTSKMATAKGNLVKAKRLYCGVGSQAGYYEARRRMYRKEITAYLTPTQ